MGKENVFDLLELLKKAGYTEGTEMRFVNDTEYAGKVGKFCGAKEGSTVSGDRCFSKRFVLDWTEPELVSSIEPFNIKGVPTILIVDKIGNIIWRGRHCCYDYVAFENFLSHAVSECSETRCPARNCDLCRNETNIDREIQGKSTDQLTTSRLTLIFLSLLDLRSEQKNLTQYVDLIGKPCNDAWTGNAAAMGKALTQRLPKISTKQLISIKSKPYNSHRADSERNLIRSMGRSGGGGSRSSLRRRPSSTDSMSGRSSSILGHCYLHTAAPLSSQHRRLKRY